MKQAWLIWILAASFFFLEYIARVSPGVMAADLMRAFHVDALSLGILSAYFYYAYVAMQIPVGTLMDKFGARLLLSVMAIIFGVGSLLFGVAGSLGIAQLARFLMGFSGAFAFVGALKLASVWFPPEKTGFIAGATQALGMLGAAVGAGPLAALLTIASFRSILILLGLIFILLALLITLFVKNAPTQIDSKKSLALSTPILQSLQIVLKNPLTWLNGVFVGLLYAPTGSFAELWGASYMHGVYALKPEIAASAVSMIFIGWGIGSPLFGWVSDRMQRRRPMLILSAFFSLVFMLLILYLPANLASAKILFLLMFLYGFTNVGVSTAYAVSFEINPRAVAGTAIGFTNMASIILGAGLQPLMGWILDKNWTGQMLSGARYYSVSNYHLAMAVLPLCLLLAFFISFFIQESYGGMK